MGGIEQEVLLWHDAQGQPQLLPDQQLQTLQTQLRAERDRADRLAAHLRSLGVDPDQLP